MKAAIDDFLPGCPDWKLDWQAINEAFDWIRALRGAPHDPVYHQEGDVWIHTRMVVEALCDLPAWKALPRDEQRICFAAALLHDVAKPATAVVDPETGRVSNRGHSSLGARQARRILWDMGFPAALREKICAIIASHQAPFWLIERPYEDARRFLAARSLECGNHLLAIVAEADARGRICPDMQRIKENVQLFRELAIEQQCLTEPYPFADDHTRFTFFNRSATCLDPRWVLYSDPCAPEAILMSGLPATGKSSWLAEHAPDLPRVSLDELRRSLGISPTGNQGAVIQAAKEAARTFLRAGQSFAWDATNLTRSQREPLIALMADYGFKVRIVALEAAPEEIDARNSKRPDPVPAAARAAMLAKWEHPSPIEAHVLESQAYCLGAEREAFPSSRP